MRIHRLTCLVLSAAFLALAVLARQPVSNPPAFPAIAPTLAWPDGVTGGLDSPCCSIAWNEDLRLLAVGCENGSLCCWRNDVALGIRPGNNSAQIIRPGHHGPVAAMVALGDQFVTGGFDGKIVFWNLAEERVVRTLNAGSHVRALAADPHGKLLASVGDDAVVQLWDVATGKNEIKLTGAGDWLLSTAFSPDGKTVAAGAIDGHWYLWDVASGKKSLQGAAASPPMPNVPANRGAVTSLAFSPDGKTLAVGSADGNAYLFNAADGKFQRALTGHTSAITAVVFHPSGTLLVTGSKDRTVRLWTPANGQFIKALEGQTAWVQGVTFLAHGTRLATAGADHAVRFWDLTEPPKK